MRHLLDAVRQSMMSLFSLVCVCRQPWYYGWGFNLPRGQALLDKWNQIPDNTDILVTHCPPLGETHITTDTHTHMCIDIQFETLLLTYIFSCNYLVVESFFLSNLHVSDHQIHFYIL